MRGLAAGRPVVSLEPSIANPRTRLAPNAPSPLLSACVAAVFLALCLLAQGLSGAWSADFLSYPDEPSHFVGAVMVRDWLVSGRWFAPLPRSALASPTKR